MQELPLGNPEMDVPGLLDCSIVNLFGNAFSMNEQRRCCSVPCQLFSNHRKNLAICWFAMPSSLPFLRANIIKIFGRVFVIMKVRLYLTTI